MIPPLMTSGRRVIYLASPYSHGNRIVRQSRANEVARIAGVLAARDNILVFSPIAHGHTIHYYSKDKPPYEYWMELSYAMLDRCDALYVAMMRGWYQSGGVQAEIRYAHQHHIPTLYLDPKDCRTYEQFIERRQYPEGQRSPDRRESLSEARERTALGRIFHLESKPIPSCDPEVRREIPGQGGDSGPGEGETLS